MAPGGHHAILTPLNCPKSYIITHLNAKIKHYYRNVNTRGMAKLGKIYKQVIVKMGYSVVLLAVCWTKGKSTCKGSDLSPLAITMPFWHG